MKAALLLAALALSACVTVPPAGPPMRGDGLAQLGEATRVGAMVVTPQAVVEDSRCPINVRCVWAGRLVISARVIYNGGSEEFHGPITLGVPLSLGREQVTLVSAEPGKMASSPLSPPASLFGFEAD